MNPPTYAPELREIASRDGLYLVTVDVPSMTVQMPCTGEQVAELTELIGEWLKEKQR